MVLETNLIYYGLPLGLGLAGIFLYIISTRNPSNYPPGPRGFPFVGALPYLTNRPERVIKKWSLDEYGPIVCVRQIGSNKFVSVNTYDLIKQVLCTEGVSTRGRFPLTMFKHMIGYTGLTFVDYSNVLKSQRSFGIQFINSFGTSGSFDIVNAEIDHLLKEFDSMLGTPINVYENLFHESQNVISKIFFGQRFEYGHSVLEKIFGSFSETLGDGEDVKRLFLMEQLPFLRFFPPFSGTFHGNIKRFSPTKKYVLETIEETRNNLDKDEKVFFIKHFLKEQKARGGNNADNEFNDEQLVGYMRDVIGGGAKSTCLGNLWMVLALLLYPDYRKQVTDEIDKVLGKESCPTPADQARMPVTWGFIYETLRICSPVFRSIDHKTHADIKLGGYDIPKGTSISANQWGANHDPETWPEPEKFDPYRHIGEDGKMIHPSKVLAFGIGARSCIAENLSWYHWFIFITRFLQRYDISAAQPDSLPSFYDGSQGVTYNPLPFEIILKRR